MFSLTKEKRKSLGSFYTPDSLAHEGALERYARNLERYEINEVMVKQISEVKVMVKQILEAFAQQANVEGTDAEIDYLWDYIGIINMLKLEIEQKYNVTIMLTSRGCIIKPNNSYLNNYWS